MFSAVIPSANAILVNSGTRAVEAVLPGVSASRRRLDAGHAPGRLDARAVSTIERLPTGTASRHSPRRRPRRSGRSTGRRRGWL